MACRSYSLYHYQLTLLFPNAILNIYTLLSLTIFQYNFIKTSAQLVGHNLLTPNFYITSLSIFIIDVFMIVSANDVHLISGSISIDSYSFPACRSHISSLHVTCIFFFSKNYVGSCRSMLQKVEIFLTLKSADFHSRRQVSCQQINLILVFKLCQ